MKASGLFFKESKINNPLKSKKVQDQKVLLLPQTYEVVFLNEFLNEKDILDERLSLIKKYYRAHGDGIPVEITIDNMYILYFKMSEEKTKTEKLLESAFNKERFGD